MLTLLCTIFIASLVGSTHCAGMCGAFLAFAVGAPGDGPAPSKSALNAAYNLGRLGTYLTLGAIAGTLGAAMDLGGSMLGIQRAAAAAAGVIMVGFGAVAVLRHLGVPVPRMPLPAALVNLSRAAHARAFELAPITRAAAVGLLTTLLPCGWLYAFVISSAGTASPLWGAAATGAFWLGTLPVMAALGLGVQSLAGPLRKHLPLATSLLLVVVGTATVVGRMTAPPIDAAVAPGRTAQESVQSIGSPEQSCPLCRGKAH